MQRCLDNGRALQELLHEAAGRYATAVKHERTRNSKRREMTRASDPQISFADLEFLHQSVQVDPVLQTISDFIERHVELIELVHGDLERGLKKPATGRKG